MKKLAALTLLVCGAAHAEFLTGNQLLAMMDGSYFEQADALGYVTGVYDAARGLEHCSPNGVTRGQVRDMVRQTLVARPESRHLSADIFVVVSLKQAWPCAQQRSNPRSGSSL